MLELDIAALQQWVGQFMWPLVRIGAFFMVVPVVGTQLVPPRVRLLLALLVTMAIAPQLHDLPQTDPLSPLSVVMIAQQVLIGVGLGLFLQLMMQAFIMMGQIIATKMGLGFASLNDPINGVTVTIVSQFNLILATLLFLAMNGHLVMIDVLVESFRTLPIGADIGGERLMVLVNQGSWMFAAGVLMALPAVTALLIVNSTLGVITRAAPQLNIFAIGFPLMLLLGFVILWANMVSFLPQFERYSSEALQQMRLWIR